MEAFILRDVNVIERIIKGDQKAFRSFYEKTFPKLFSFTLKHTSDQELAREIVQDAYVVIWEKKNAIKALQEVFEAYLFTYVRHRCIREYKRKITEAEALLSYREEISRMVFEESVINLPDINKILNVLPKRQRIVLELVKLQGLSYKETAAKLNISERTVETHLRKAFTTLRLEVETMHLSLLFLLIFS
ncbi:RNA polymerase sigma factor [Sinomicrobium oceani]|uniref:RNA polymerase sigma factor n=1 Tax=Sinomicrobium oceani TaxID=1150368 RepID=UPI0015873C4C|nr:sigma-70 family RNA polymerase sigma factor [Sinomicrobium oceani]